MILRRDKQLGYMLMPAQKMYQQMDFASAQKQSGGQPQDSVDITEVGSETIEGQATTKYKMIMKDGSAGGFMWITKDGILVKMDSVVKNGNKKTRMTMTLKNLKIGSKDRPGAVRSAGRLQRDAGLRRRHVRRRCAGACACRAWAVDPDGTTRSSSS